MGSLAYRLCGTAKGRAIRESLAAGQTLPPQDPGAQQLHRALEHDPKRPSPAIVHAKTSLATTIRTSLSMENQLARLHTLGMGLDFLFHTHY
jgi:hypothetical protein